MGLKAIFSSHEFDQNDSQKVLWYTLICQHFILSPLLQESVLWMCRLRVWEEPAEATNGSIIWFIKLVKISQNVQRAIVSLNLFHELGSSLTQSSLACFHFYHKRFFLKEPFNCDHGFSSTVNTKKSWSHMDTSVYWDFSKSVHFSPLRTCIFIISSLYTLNELIHQYSRCSKLQLVSNVI